MFTLLFVSVSVPDGLAVDPVSRLLFYTDAGNNDIRLMKVDGFDEKVVVNSDLDQPRTIVLDCLKGFVAILYEEPFVLKT